MSNRDVRRWHYLRPNETTRVPRRLIFLDTESTMDRTAFGHTQSWALAVACYRDQRPDRRPRESWGTYDDPEILWKEVDAHCGASGRTVLWCHNLGYDARISEMFELLPAMGWALVSHNLATKGCWLMWRRGRASLTMVDSTAVFPMQLIQLGTLLGIPKLRLPPTGSGGVGLYSRCWRDVEILRQAVIEYLQWIEDEDLGNWQLTGAGQSWAAYRHRFMDSQLLIHDDADALRAERRAMWTGRCEAYWHGEIGYQVVHEWDFSLAYPRIARDINVPVRLLGPMPDQYDWRKVLGSATTALLAVVTVRTEMPVVPTVHDGRILWPVGEFETTLWDVEIQEALDAGATVTVRQGWLYRKAPALRRWATWVIEQLESATGPELGWKHPVLKHHGRALIGRFAMTYTEWEPWCTTPFNAVRQHQVYDADSDETFRAVQIGQTMWRDRGQREWGESMPMVTGYIQAVCRVRLWRAWRAMPPRSVLYMDTDGFLVTDKDSVYVERYAQAHPELGLRLKRSWDGFGVWGPRQIRTGNMVRVSGIPRYAVEVDRGTFDGQVWETLEGAMVRGNAGRVVIRDRRWRVHGIDRRRDGPPVGWTTPVRLPHTGRSTVTSTEEDDHEQECPGHAGGREARGREPGARRGSGGAQRPLPRGAAPGGRHGADAGAPGAPGGGA